MLDSRPRLSACSKRRKTTIVIARRAQPDAAISYPHWAMGTRDCFASLAMTVLRQSTGPGLGMTGAFLMSGRTASQSTPWNSGSGMARTSSSPR